MYYDSQFNSWVVAWAIVALLLSIVAVGLSIMCITGGVN